MDDIAHDILSALDDTLVETPVGDKMGVASTHRLEDGTLVIDFEHEGPERLAYRVMIEKLDF